MRKGLPGKIGNVSHRLREIRPVCRLVREAEEGAGGGKGAERGRHTRHEARYGDQTVQAEARQEVKNGPRSDPGALFLCPFGRPWGLVFVISGHGKTQHPKPAYFLAHKIGSDFLRMRLTQPPIMTKPGVSARGLLGA